MQLIVFVNKVWFGLGWFMVFNAIFNNISVISCGQFYWWMKPENTTTLSLTYNMRSLHVNLDQTKYVVFNILFGMQNDKFSYKMKKTLK
jgi:hypothetical protein